MADRWMVLGGWGVEPEVLKPLFGAQSIYIDTNRLVPHLVNHGHLRPDWQERCIASIAPQFGQGSRLLAGWSTGAMIALACSAHIRSDALVLISATLSFCRTTQFRHGMRSTVLDAMIKKLPNDTPAILHDFRTRCGLPPPETAYPWSSDDLAAGLCALAEITVPVTTTKVPPPLFIHGRCDAIIPFAAGEQACTASGGIFHALDAPHACFINHEQQIRNAIDHYQKELDHEPV